MEGRRSRPRTTRAASPNVSLLEASDMRKTAAPDIKVSYVEQDGEVVTVLVGEKFSEMCDT